MRGHWQDDATFITEYIEDLNTEIDGKTQKFTFAGDRVTIDVSSSMDGLVGQAVGELVK